LIKSSFIEETEIEVEKVDLEINETELKEILISSMLDTKLINTNEDEINFIAKFLENPKKFLNEVIFKYPFLSNENLVF